MQIGRLGGLRPAVGSCVGTVLRTATRHFDPCRVKAMASQVRMDCSEWALYLRYSLGESPNVSENTRLNVRTLWKPEAKQMSLMVRLPWRRRLLAYMRRVVLRYVVKSTPRVCLNTLLKCEYE